MSDPFILCLLISMSLISDMNVPAQHNRTKSEEIVFLSIFLSHWKLLSPIGMCQVQKSICHEV